MFTYIKPHPGPSLLYPHSGKVVRSNTQPCFVELLYREHTNSTKDAVVHVCSLALSNLSTLLILFI